jgi:uncharacterized protein (TIGR03437 family)
MSARALFFLLCSSLCFAQFADLATTDDGAHLYFSSRVRLRDSDQYPHEKLFRYQAGRFELIRQIPFEDNSGFLTTNFHQVIEPDVSGDGTILAYAARLICRSVSSCLSVERHRSTVMGPGIASPIEFNGKAQISGNGRYVLRYRAADPAVEQVLVDLATGQETALPPSSYFSIDRRALTSQGAVLAVSYSSPQSPRIVIWENGEIRDVAAGGGDQRRAINDRGTTVVLAPPLRVIELATGQVTRIETEPLADAAPQITNDGQLIAYIAGSVPQVWLVGADGSRQRRMTSLDEGISSATISGSGNVIYASSRSGRMVRIDTATGETRELIPRTPLISAVHGAAVPGSMNFIQGTGLSDTTAVAEPPLSESLGGVEVHLNGRPVPIHLVSPTEVRFQIPFEAEASEVQLELGRSQSPFEQAATVRRIEASSPVFIFSGREISIPGIEYGAVVIHQDFGSLVGPGSPAEPGEIVHFYLTGLGQTVPPLSTGVPWVYDPATRLREPPECRFTESGVRTPVEPLYAGPAPTMIGIYQLSVRLPANPAPGPADPSRSFVSFRCGDDSGDAAFALIPVRLAP